MEILVSLKSRSVTYAYILDQKVNIFSEIPNVIRGVVIQMFLKFRLFMVRYK